MSATSPSPATAVPAERPSRIDLPPEVRKIAIVVIVGAIMSILDTTIVNVALRSLAEDLHGSLDDIQWVSTGYLLALATVIPMTGWAAERFGPKRVWLTAVAGFVATSALCAVAWSPGSLVGFRVLQGFAGGMIMPIGMITLAQAAGPSRMGRVMSVVGVPMLLAPVLGPVIGGLIVTHLSWRWIFLVNLPIGIFGLVLAARLLPSERATGRGAPGAGPPRLDVLGVLLLSPGLALAVFGLSEVASQGSVSAGRMLPIVAGLVLIVLFTVHAWRADHPLVDVRLFREGGFAAAAVTVFLVGAALFGALFLLPLYYQLDRAESALTAGLLMAPQGLGAAFGMNIGGRLTDRVGGGRVVLVGLLILSVGTLPFATVTDHTSYWLLSGALVIRGVGLGFTMMPAMAAAYATLERNQVPRATPMLNVLQRVGGSLGVAVLAVVLQNRITDTLGAQAGGSVGEIPASAQAKIASPLAHAFAQTYWWALAATLVAIVPAAVLALMQRAERRRERSVSEAALA